MADLKKASVVILGGGPAGMAAAMGALGKGAHPVIIERDFELGGILNQCIHSGFGLHHFGEELTGPEYAQRFKDMVKNGDIEVMTDTMAMGFDGKNKVIVMSPKVGYKAIDASAIVLAMGCRERSRGAISIPGERPSGVMTAGLAQKYINIDGCMVGRRVVILGSGDIGLIMARRMSLEGAEVLACVEIMPYSSGLTRNVVQCLNDFDIPLFLNHTVTKICGYPRVEGVYIAKVDEDKKPICETERYIECDTLLLSVGLIPENELSAKLNIAIDPRTRGPFVRENMETLADGVFACGNVLHVHDLVDFVTEEGYRAGEAAAEHALCGHADEGVNYEVQAGENVSYTVPQYIREKTDREIVPIKFRVKRPIAKGEIRVSCGGEVIFRKKRQFMTPGESEKIEIRAELVKSDIEVLVLEEK